MCNNLKGTVPVSSDYSAYQDQNYIFNAGIEAGTTLTSPSDDIAADAFADMAQRGLLLDAVAWEMAVGDYTCRLNDQILAYPERGDVIAETLGQHLAVAESISVAASMSLDGRIRCDWGLSWPGRLHSRQPNLQGVTRALRAPFHTSDGYVFIIGDLDRAHPRIGAALSGDTSLAEVSAPGRDFHQAVGDHIVPNLDRWERRKLGKTFNSAMLNLAGVEGIIDLVARRAWMDLSVGEAGTMRANWRSAFPTYTRWAQGLESRMEWVTPLGRTVVVPEGRRYPQAVVAGVLQSFESDALRLVLMASNRWMAGTGAVPILAIHDGVIWEVPVRHAHGARKLAETLMSKALSLICRGIPVSADVKIRKTWGAS